MANFNNACYKNPTNPYPIGECTAYCWGRTYEVCGSTFANKLSGLKHAKNWYKAPHGYLTGKECRSTSIAVIDYKDYGHVVFIEDYNEETGQLRFSEANYYSDSRLSNGQWEPESAGGTDGKIITMDRSKFEKRLGTFLGYIYLV